MGRIGRVWILSSLYKKREISHTYRFFYLSEWKEKLRFYDLSKCTNLSQASEMLEDAIEKLAYHLVWISYSIRLTEHGCWVIEN